MSPFTGNKSYTERFLDKPVGSTPEVEAIINLLKTENEKTGFIEKLPGNAGLPVWDKFIKNKPKPNPNEAARGVIADKNGNYLIPLSNDQITLSAVLFALYQDGKYNFYCYTNDYLYKICHSTNYPVPVREKALALFMYMSNYVFGISEFRNIPLDLFQTPYYKKDGQYLKSLIIKPVGEVAPDTAYIETLKVVTVCIQIWEYDNCTCPDEKRNPNDCDWCGDCAPPDCFGEWIPTDGGGVSFGDNSGEPPLPPADPISGGNTPSSPPSPPCPGSAWYVKALLVGSQGQNCDPSYNNPCGPDGFMIDNECVSPSHYPGKEEGYPYFWWQDRNWMTENLDLNMEDNQAFLGLTEAEWDFIWNHPRVWGKIYNNSNVAKNEAKSRYLGDWPIRHNDKGDAFRHTYWMALNYWTADNEDKHLMREYGIAHESETVEPLEKTMDLRNNDAGIEACAELLSTTPYPLPPQVLTVALNAIANGESWYLDPVDVPNHAIQWNTQLKRTNQ